MGNRVGGWAVPILLFALGCSGFLPLSSWAADPIGKLSVSGQVGYATYALSDINAAVGRSGRLIQPPAPWELPERLHHGFDFVSDASYDVTRDLRLSLNYGRTSGESKKDFVQIISVSTKVTTINPRVLYRLPWRPVINMSLRAYGGPIFLRNAKTEVSHEDTDVTRLETLTINGQGTGFAAGIAGEYTLSDRFTVGFEWGYRRAKAGHKSSSYRISKLLNGGLDDDRDGLPNDRELGENSYLWGFMQSGPPAPPSEEARIRPLAADFSGLDIRIAMHVYIF